MDLQQVPTHPPSRCFVSSCHTLSSFSHSVYLFLVTACVEERKAENIKVLWTRLFALSKKQFWGTVEQKA
ncbi:rCG63709 [Rattus norvegicus]|uniref:RCG63709 n=1 Tax=Rattus norvegicus TaxID=10116 RepID=A6IGW8_RAT|nr:rCG63709 [Rattus norvegicus]